MKKVIVSLTSYPQRIHTVYRVLDTLIRQTVLPDKMILYLSASEFKDFGKLPDWEKYEKYGFEVHWHEENLRSHKKWFYAFQEYKGDIVITVDDDVLYKEDMIENLLRYHTRFPNCVITRNAHLITCKEDGTIAPYENWSDICAEYVGSPRMALEAIGNGGILYPTYLFDNAEIFKKEFFMEKCAYADDLWLKIMEAYQGVATVLSEGHWNDPILQEQQKNSLYQDHNKNGGNDRQLEELLKAYPYTAQKENLSVSLLKGCRTYEEDQKEMDSILDKMIEKMRGFGGAILVYGAGEAGHRIYTVLKKTNLDIIKAFIVKDPSDNVDKIGDVEVRSYKEFIDSSEKILIALTDDNTTEEVCSMLIKEGVAPERIVKMDRYETISLMKQVDPNFDSGKYWEQRYARGVPPAAVHIIN